VAQKNALVKSFQIVIRVPGPTWKAQSPVPVIDPEILGGVSVSLRAYDVSPDGRRFLVIKDAPGSDSSATSSGIVVVQNWVEEFKYLAPARR
jgi:hypothetical protein